MRMERDKLRAERRRQLEMQKRDNERRRAEIEATKAQAAQSLHNLKRQTVRMTREERRLNEDFVSYSKEQDHAQNVQRKLEVLMAEREKDAKLRGKLASIEQNVRRVAARRAPALARLMPPASGPAAAGAARARTRAGNACAPPPTASPRRPPPPPCAPLARSLTLSPPLSSPCPPAS